MFVFLPFFSHSSVHQIVCNTHLPNKISPWVSSSKKSERNFLVRNERQQTCIEIPFFHLKMKDNHFEANKFSKWGYMDSNLASKALRNSIICTDPYWKLVGRWNFLSKKGSLPFLGRHFVHFFFWGGTSWKINTKNLENQPIEIRKIIWTPNLHDEMGFQPLICRGITVTLPSFSQAFCLFFCEPRCHFWIWFLQGLRRRIWSKYFVKSMIAIGNMGRVFGAFSRLENTVMMRMIDDGDLFLWMIRFFLRFKHWIYETKWFKISIHLIPSQDSFGLLYLWH